jgi:hypothetical protein
MKSKPIGVRFDLDKLDMIQKEQNLTSVQQVVNYLMDNYSKPLKNIPISSTGTSYFDLNSAGHTLTTTPNTPPIGLTGIDLAIWKSENCK